MRKKTAMPGKLRLIAGKWRGRRIVVPAVPGLRPTPDRVRETLFNWLAPVLPGMHCLDLFAGTGALGLEALSRGAASVCFVELNRQALRALEDSAAGLGCSPEEVAFICADALGYLAGSPRAFDLVFLDPPFATVDMGHLCTLLDDGWLTAGALIYIERARSEKSVSLPPGWELLREKEAGRVRHALYRRGRTQEGD